MTEPDAEAYVQASHPVGQGTDELRERTVVFGSKSRLIGVESGPHPGGQTSEQPAFLLLNSGLVHRVGPSRLGVRLARRLARSGFVTLRFDHSGVGDSPPAPDGRSVHDRWRDEVGEALDHLAETRGIRYAVVLGNCSGAAGGFLAASADARVVGAALLNPPGPLPLRYHLRLMRAHPSFWRRLFRGRFKMRLLLNRPAPSREGRSRQPSRDEVVEALTSIAGRGARLLILTCEWDASYDRIYLGMREELERRAPHGAIAVRPIRGSNHMFSLLRHQEQMMHEVLQWAEGFRPD